MQVKYATRDLMLALNHLKQQELEVDLLPQVTEVSPPDIEMPGDDPPELVESSTVLNSEVVPQSFTLTGQCHAVPRLHLLPPLSP